MACRQYEILCVALADSFAQTSQSTENIDRASTVYAS